MKIRITDGNDKTHEVKVKPGTTFDQAVKLGQLLLGVGAKAVTVVR